MLHIFCNTHFLSETTLKTVAPNMRATFEFLVFLLVRISCCMAETLWRINQYLRFINANQTALYFAIASHITLGNCKTTLLQKMNQIQSIGHFIRTNKGYRVTAPEGYVAVDKAAGAVKLVDRLEFSRQNFTMPKGW